MDSSLEFFIKQENSHELDYINLEQHFERIAEPPPQSPPSSFEYNAMNNLLNLETHQNFANSGGYPSGDFMNWNNLGKNTVQNNDYFDAGDLKFLCEFLDSEIKMDNNGTFEAPIAISTSATVTTTIVTATTTSATIPAANAAAAAISAANTNPILPISLETDSRSDIRRVPPPQVKHIPAETGFVCRVAPPVKAEQEKKAIVREMRRPQTGRFRKSALLEMEDIQKYFGMPIIKAAKEMKVGLTVLKKRCRELNITRWPHRKIKSLKTLINNVKVMGLELKEIEMLEEHKKMVERLPQLELNERAKKLRQACFKDNYKKRKSIGRA